MNDRILFPYIFTDSELETIETHFQTHTDWTKSIFSSIKNNIIKYLRIQQGNTCCYCKYQLGFDIKEVDIEHIVPKGGRKGEYEKFTFEKNNLALSCPACNTKKSTKDVLNNKVLSYPTDGKDFIIVHAHLDNYSEHITIYDKCVFSAKTEKGKETIICCDLLRLTIVEEKAKAYTPSLLKQLVKDLNNPNEQYKNELLAIIKNAIR